MWRNGCGFLLYIYGLGVVCVGSGKKNFCHMDTWNARIFIFWEAEMISSYCLQALKLREPRVAIECSQRRSISEKRYIITSLELPEENEAKVSKGKKTNLIRTQTVRKKKRTERPLQIINH